MSLGLRKRTARQISRPLVYLVLIMGMIVFLIPFFWMLSTAVKTLANIANYPVELWPAKPCWDNFLEVWRRVDVARYMLNSLVLACVYGFSVVFSSSLAGYGFARFNVPGKNLLFVIVLSTMMVPGMVMMIPQFIIYHFLGLLNTYWPWLIEGLATSAFMIFLFRQFFSTIPKDLEDAATIDGCGRFRIYSLIFLPLSKPALATAFIFAFTWVWGDYLKPNLYLTGRTIPMCVALIRGLNPPIRPIESPDTPVQMAGSIFYTLPLIAIFFMAQKYITQGIVTTGIKQ